MAEEKLNTPLDYVQQDQPFRFGGFTRLWAHYFCLSSLPLTLLGLYLADNYPQESLVGRIGLSSIAVGVILIFWNIFATLRHKQKLKARDKARGFSS